MADKMLEIYVHGIEDGSRDVSLTAGVETIPELFEEFFGEVTVNGKLRKLGNRYSFTGTATCKARLICDRTLREYTETIQAELKLSYLADTALYNAADGDGLEKSEQHIIHEDEKYIDLSDEVREHLAVNLPMKRIAPDVKDKDIEEIYPEHTAESHQSGEEIDERWSALKNIKFNN
ncbi:MAG: YceD family protein [Bacteroidota bacterium]